MSIALIGFGPSTASASADDRDESTPLSAEDLDAPAPSSAPETAADPPSREPTVDTVVPEPDAEPSAAVLTASIAPDTTVATPTVPQLSVELSTAERRPAVVVATSAPYPSATTPNVDRQPEVARAPEVKARGTTTPTTTPTTTRASLSDFAVRRALNSIDPHMAMWLAAKRGEHRATDADLTLAVPRMSPKKADSSEKCYWIPWPVNKWWCIPKDPSEYTADTIKWLEDDDNWRFP